MNSLKRILVFRFSSLGDVALTVPVLNAVIEQNPGVEITIVTPKFMHDMFPPYIKCEDIDKNGKHKGILGLRKLFSELNAQNYDAVADLHGVLRSFVLDAFFRSHRIPVQTIDKGRKEKKRLIGHALDYSRPLKHTTERYADVFRKLGLKVVLDHSLKNQIPSWVKPHSNAPKNRVGIAPFARHPGKMFSLSEMKKVAVLLAEQGNEVFLFGSESELKQIQIWERQGSISCVKEDNLRDELKKMASLSHLISMDSANMHLASLVGIPVISVWGVTHPFMGFTGYGQSLKNCVQDNSLSWRPTSVFGNKLGPEDNPNGMKNIVYTDIVKEIKEE